MPIHGTRNLITADGTILSLPAADGSAGNPLVTNADGTLDWVAVSAAELGYLSGVTSAIQTQLDGKSATGHTHTASDVTDFDTEVSNNTTVASALQDVVDDTTPQLGGYLDTNANHIRFDNGTGIHDNNGNETLIFDRVASAVNYVNVTNAATGNGPSIESKGPDSNIDLTLKPKGSGDVVLGNPAGGWGGNLVLDHSGPEWGMHWVSGFSDVGKIILDGSSSRYSFELFGNEQFRVQTVGDGTNVAQVSDGTTGNGPTLEAVGSDTNVDLNLAAKGIGAVHIDGTALYLDAGEDLSWGAGSGIIEAGATTDEMTFKVAGFTTVATMTASALEMSQDIVLYKSAGGPSANIEGSLWYDTSLGDGRAVVHQAGNNAKAIARMSPIQIRPQQLIADSTSGFGITTRNQHVLAAFDDTTDEIGYFTGVMPSDYNGDGIDVQISWAAASATTGNVVWEVAFERIGGAAHDIDSDGFAAVNAVTSTAQATNGAIRTSTISFTDGVDMDDVDAGTPAFRMKIIRNADTGNDTMVGDAQILAMNIQGTNDFY